MKTAILERFILDGAFLFALLSVAAVFSITGCASSGSGIEVQQSPVMGLNRYKIVAVDVSTQDPDFESTKIEQLTGSILTRLRNSGKFYKVYATSFTIQHDADLRLSVVVQFVVNGERHSAIYVNKPSSVDASVALIEASNGKALASAIVHSHTGSALVPGISQAPTMSDAIEKLSDQIVTFVIKP
jgi:hypothetical protein